MDGGHLFAPVAAASDTAKSAHVGRPDLDLGDKVHRILPVQYPSTMSPLQHCVSPESVTKLFVPPGHILTTNPSLLSKLEEEFFKK
jgi:hypothetical protein